MRRRDVAREGSGGVNGQTTTADGAMHSVHLPFGALSSLLMTLPRMLQAALDARCSDASLCVAQPLARWRVEQVQRHPGLVLKLASPDGFEVAFAMDGRSASELGMALVAAFRKTKSSVFWRLHG